MVLLFHVWYYALVHSLTRISIWNINFDHNCSLDNYPSNCLISSMRSTLLEFSRVVKVREQVVAGMVYYLTIEAADSGHEQAF